MVALACALHFRKWGVWFQKKTCKLVSSLSKSTFSKAWSWRKNDQDFLLHFHVSKRRCQPRIYGIWEVSEEAGWAGHASLLWSGVLVAIQTQINRGGTLELMIEEGGGGVSEGGLSAPEPRSPEKWRTGAHYAHFQSQLRTGLPRCCCLSSKLLRLFPQLFTTCHIAAKVRDTRADCMATWEFHGLGTWKTFSGALLELVASVVTVDYWYTAGPLAAIYWGKILFDRVNVSLLQEDSQLTC